MIELDTVTVLKIITRILNILHRQDGLTLSCHVYISSSRVTLDNTRVNLAAAS